MKLEELTALYSPLDIEYAQAMSGEYEDLSFKSDEVTVIAGLKDGRISGFWRPVVAVGDDKLQKLHIERLYDTCRNIYYMDFLIDGKLSVISQFLLRHRHKARPYYTQIIDLTKSEEELHANLRKSYKSLVSNTDNIKPTSIYEYQNIHERVKGKKRSQDTWEIMSNINYMCCVKQNAGVMIIINGECAYYMSAAGDNTHSILWYLIRESKKYGCKLFELGEQIFSGNEKLVNISKFKRGFGGTTQTRLILEKEQ